MRKWYLALLVPFVIGTRLPGQNPDWRAVERDYQDAQEALRSGRDSVALADFEDILRLNPSNAQAHANIGVIYLGRKAYSRAAQEF